MNGMIQTRVTRQRTVILEELRKLTCHPTADELCDIVRRRLPHISLGTVYRNLSLLSETGQILKLNMRDSADRFDGRITPHDHFVCERCHCVEDIFLDDNEEITIAAQKKFDGKIRSHTTTFYGICKKCLA